MPPKKSNGKSDKRVTRYTFNDVKEPRTPETGHTALLPAEEQVVTLPMDNGWSKAIKVGKLPEGDERPVVVDMDPAADPTLFWSGKRNRRQVPILPLQRNEVVSDSRIAQIIERARKAAEEKAPQMSFGAGFADLEKTFREGDKSKRVGFYQHDEGWKNKLICGDSLHVMESLLHYEGLRNQVQMIYLDPPYGIKYNSNFQQRVNSTKNDDKDQADDVLTVKAFRDTWALGIHSYLSYLSERLYLCREMLANSGSIFVQISDENVHVVRALLDETFGQANFASQITFQKTGSQETTLLGTTVDYLLWYVKDKEAATKKYHQLYLPRKAGDLSLDRYDQVELASGSTRRITAAEIRGELAMPAGKRFQATSLLSDGETSSPQDFEFQGKLYRPRAGTHWKTAVPGLKRLAEKGRIVLEGSTLRYKRFAEDFNFVPINDRWESMQIGRARDYVVQTAESVIERCILMTTDPSDIVFDPTCGSGTTAFCAERFGRRWITCDTSRVAINIARQRLISAVFDQYQTMGPTVASGFICKKAKRTSLETLAKDMEPESVELVDAPEIDRAAVRVTGPFEVMSLGRYSIEDWKGSVVTSGGDDVEQAKLENYIEVVCRLYRKNAAIQGASGLVHAIAESEKHQIAISVGPLSGRVTGKQINDATQDSLSSGILEVHILGWAFEANVGEVKAQLEKRGKVKIVLQMIRPDTLSEGLKVTQPETLFSPLALPEIEVKAKKNGKEKLITVLLKGVAIFDRANRSTDWKEAGSGYISAWYLDEDYDGDCFVDCQMFFDFKKAPNLKAQLGLDVQPEEYKLALESQPFHVRGYKRIAVKVVDVYGNESTVVQEI